MQLCEVCQKIEKLEQNKRKCANCQKENIVYGVICYLCSEKNEECIVCRDKIQKPRDVDKYINYTVIRLKIAYPVSLIFLVLAIVVFLALIIGFVMWTTMNIMKNKSY